MPECAPSGRTLAVTIAALIAASAMLGGAAMLGWAQLDLQVPLRGIVQVRVNGSAVLPALAPLALLALAAVAAALATPGWARWLLGALLLLAAVPPSVAGVWLVRGGVGGGRWLTGTAMAAVELPDRSVPVGTAMVLGAGPALAAGGAALLAAAGVTLVVRGHRMPQLGRRYQAPAARPDGQVPPDGRFWERMDAGEDPTASGHPR
ncbi:MAG TPA: Trp biosynthesis-associated membrane protein [Pseudonocardiaceae bacterium]|nr:Trp biosynthesis-associated membrane protein [Pseudonocardiaceae bacterium]